jgi:hypothetical protein
METTQKPVIKLVPTAERRMGIQRAHVETARVGAEITAHDVYEMVEHWLGTPPNGYLGAGYGSDIKALLQTALNSGLMDDFIAKMLFDIPLLKSLPKGSISIGYIDVPPDQKRLAIRILDETFFIDGFESAS